jgi:signal transduction histidine kinase
VPATPQTTFVPSVAHELRGPLSSVVAFAHLLGDPSSGELTEDQRTYLDVIDRNANRLLRLIEDLLLLSRLQAGRLPLKTTQVRLPALIEEVVAARLGDAATAAVSIDADLLDGPELACDEARIQQVLHNLLANALEFTPAGGRIVVSARPDDGGWQLAVGDNGIGIPAAEQDKLFSPFFRASNVAEAGRSGTPGAGLGLLISRAIVELHGGGIQVASTEGVGTTVTVTLPTEAAARNRDGG